MKRSEEKKLLDDWFASVSFTDEPKPSMPAPDPEDPDDDYTGEPLALSHVRAHVRRQRDGKVVNVREYDTKTQAQKLLQHLALRAKAQELKPLPPHVPSEVPTENIEGVPVDLQGAAPELRPVIEDQARRIFSENPGLSRQVKAIKVQPFSAHTEAGKELLLEGFADTGMAFDDVLGFQSIYDGSLYLNGTVFGSSEAAHDVAVQQPAGWFSTPVHTSEDLARETMTHEMGHAANRVWQGKDMDEGLQEILKEEGIGHALPDGSTRISVSGIKSHLSEYGAKNQPEFVAEAWAEYNLSPHPRTIAAKVGKILRDRLAKSNHHGFWGLPSRDTVQRGGPLRVTTGAPNAVLRFREHLPEEVIWTWPSPQHTHEWQEPDVDADHGDSASDDN